MANNADDGFRFALPILPFPCSSRFRRHCERSEAIHLTACGEMDCFVAAAPRNDGGETSNLHVKQRCGYASAFPRRDPPELLSFSPSQSAEGAGKTGCALHPRSRVQTCTKKRTRAYRFSGNTPAFPAQWFYGLFRALPGDRLSCHRRRADTSAQLDASIGAPGPHV